MANREKRFIYIGPTMVLNMIMINIYFEVYTTVVIQFLKHVYVLQGQLVRFQT